MSFIRNSLIYMAKTPLWLLSLLGQGKSFKANPVLGNVVLNRCGLHVVRFLVAHLMANWRMILLARLVPPEDRKELRTNGFILKENFLNKDTFAALNQEVRHARGEVRECVQGDTLTHRLLLDDKALQALPMCNKLIAFAPFQHLLKYTATSLSAPLIYIQSIKNKSTSGGPDPQKNCHSDTFHATMKAWLFLDDVTLANGPFSYVKGSHKLTWARLKWEYRRSITVRANPDGYSEKGSFRASADDLQRMGLTEPTPLEVPKNTLVVANTHGFHCRGQSNQPSSRLEIWAFSRCNPFSPFPGMDFELKRQAEHFVVHRLWQRQDKKHGPKASWHVVNPDKLHERTG